MRLLHASILVVIAGCGFEHGQLTDVKPDAADTTTPPPVSRECRYPDPSLRLCLEFDDGVLSPTVHDASPNALTATAAGLTQVMRAATDPAAQAESANVRIMESPALDIANAITIEMWINPMRNEDAVLLANEDQYGIGVTRSGHVGCGIAGRQVFSYTEGTVAANEWSHVACTFDGTRVRAFVNGVSTDCALTTSKIDTDGNKGTRIVPSFDGGIDGIRVYAADLTSQMCARVGKTNCQLECP